MEAVKVENMREVERKWGYRDGIVGMLLSGREIRLIGKFVFRKRDALDRVVR
jgi:hypothetical protein